MSFKKSGSMSGTAACDTIVSRKSLISMGACSIWAFSISKLRKYWSRMDRVLTPLTVLVDQVTSEIPPLREQSPLYEQC